jgi:sugar lactone lactonase YvrE
MKFSKFRHKILQQLLTCSLFLLWASDLPAQALQVSTLTGKYPGGADGMGSSAKFYQPFGVAVDNAGNVYVADRGNFGVPKITPAGIVTTLAGLEHQMGSADGTGSDARFNDHLGVAVDGTGNVYVADTDNSTIRKITPGGVATTLAGLAGNKDDTDGVGDSARFESPFGVAVDRAGNVYVADGVNNTIRKITSSGVVTTLAGKAIYNTDEYNSFKFVRGSTDGTGSNARFANPTGVAVDRAGNVYVADRSNFTIRKITAGGVVTTLAGSAGLRGSMDGIGNSARFDEPFGVAVDGAGNVYVADTGNNVIRKITPGGVVTTILGVDGVSGKADGIGSSAQFNQPHGVAVDSAGNIYVADCGNYAIRKTRSVPATGITSLPQYIWIYDDQAFSLSVTVTSSGTPSWKWYKDGFVIPGATSPTYSIGRASANDSGVYTVTVTDGNNISATSNACRVAVYHALSITSQPKNTKAYINQNFTLSATNTWGMGPLSYQWYKNGKAIPHTNSSDYSVARATAGDAGAYTVEVGDLNTSVTSTPAIVTVTRLNLGIMHQPRNATAIVGRIFFVSVETVGGDEAIYYQWYKNGIPIPGATSSSFVVDRATTDHAGSYTVIASDSKTSITSNPAIVTVVPAFRITIQPKNAILSIGQALSLSVNAKGGGSVSYQWYKDGTTIRGATSATYTITRITTGDFGTYTVRVINKNNTVTSDPLLLHIYKPY